MLPRLHLTFGTVNKIANVKWPTLAHIISTGFFSALSDYLTTNLWRCLSHQLSGFAMKTNKYWDVSVVMSCSGKTPCRKSPLSKSTSKYCCKAVKVQLKLMAFVFAWCITHISCGTQEKAGQRSPHIIRRPFAKQPLWPHCHLHTEFILP